MHGSGKALLLAIAIGACGAPAPGVAREAPRTASIFADAPTATLALPSALKEVSGLAVAADGRVFAHDDERAVVRQIDLASGAILKSFAVGAEVGDFEGLAIVGADFHLITSTGRVLRFREAADGARAPFTAFDVGLAGICEIEGLAYDKTSDSLIIPCKQMRDPARGGTVALYAWSLRTQRRGDRPWRIWPMATLAAAAQVESFHPATAEFDPRSGRLILVAGRESALVEIAPHGAILAGRRLGSRHFQPEGAAILPDGSLLIADEARKKGRASLTRYPHRP
jgi:uncharacterized protein YjiK